MSKNVIKDKSFAFALRIVKLCVYLREERREFVLSKQLLRSGTSIGANVREAEFGASYADFINKCVISLKEANETEYWIELLFQSNFLDQKQYESLKNDIVEIIKILISIVKTSKINKNNE